MNEKTTWMPTAAVSLEDQVKILQSYVALSKSGKIEVHYKNVVEDTKLGRTQISGVNAFFQSLGFLTSTKRGFYVPTDSVIQSISVKPPANPFPLLADTLRNSRLWDMIANKFVVTQQKQVEKSNLVRTVLRLADSSEKYRAESALEWFFRANLLKIVSNDKVELVQSETLDNVVKQKHILDIAEDLIQIRVDNTLWAIDRNLLTKFVLENGQKLSHEFVLE